MKKTSPTLMALPCSVALLLFSSGCPTVPPAPQPGIRVSESAKVVTYDIDAREYNEIAAYMHQSIAQSGQVKKGGVIALGPVSIALDDAYRFDARRLQEKLQVQGLRSGLVNFNFAVDAMAGNNAAAERMKIMQLQWEKENTVDSMDLRTFGDLTKVDYLLFGRLSSHTVRKGAAREVTYTYNWKLGNCQTGTLVWADETEINKSNIL